MGEKVGFADPNEEEVVRPTSCRDRLLEGMEMKAWSCCNLREVVGKLIPIHVKCQVGSAIERKGNMDIVRTLGLELQAHFIR